MGRRDRQFQIGEKRYSWVEMRLIYWDQLDAKITAKGPPARGRKHAPDYLSRYIRDWNRLILLRAGRPVYQFETREVRRRYRHKLTPV